MGTSFDFWTLGTPVWEPVLTFMQSRAVCVGEPQQNAGAEKQNGHTLLLFSSVYHRHVILFRYDVHHLSSSLHIFRSKPLHHLQACKYPPKSKDLCPPSCIITHSANPPPPPKWWWGTKQEVKGDLKAPATHRPTHPSTSPLLTLLSQAAAWLCVLAPVQVLVL